MKIISLVPSITETLFDFGLMPNEVVGRTKFCIHPEAAKEVPIMGGTKNLHLDRIYDLEADLIIANREENDRLQIEELMKTQNVWVTDVVTLEDNADFLRALGAKLERQAEAEKFVSDIDQVFGETSGGGRLSVAYLIWNKPYMVAAADTFINSVLEKLGFENHFKNRSRYPEVTTAELEKTDLIMLSSEPFPFKEDHADELREFLPNAKIIFVDGEAFSWFGSHLGRCGGYFRELQRNYSGLGDQ